jgi:hypothetical protein
MSATVDGNRFANYFGGSDRAVVVELEGRTSLYLDQLLPKLCDHAPLPQPPKPSAGWSQTKDLKHHKGHHESAVEGEEAEEAAAAMAEADLAEALVWAGLPASCTSYMTAMGDQADLDYRLIAQTIFYIVERLEGQRKAPNARTDKREAALAAAGKGVKKGPEEKKDVGEKEEEEDVAGAILVFLPGWQEIQELLRVVATANPGLNLWLKPLHSAVSSAEQKSVFHRPPKGFVKVIVSTNIAETSLTIEDVVYVIDAGRVKVTLLASRSHSPNPTNPSNPANPANPTNSYPHHNPKSRKVHTPDKHHPAARDAL